jgi:hypothetical protein
VFSIDADAQRAQRRRQRGREGGERRALVGATYPREQHVADHVETHPVGVEVSHNPYTVGGPRYELDTQFAGHYRAVVTMMNDNDTKPSFEDGFLRLLSATPETLARRGTTPVPADLVNVDGSINQANRLAETELYRSYLGFKLGALLPGDLVEVSGKGSFFGGDPEFVDQEGIYADHVEFKIVGHDDSLAKPTYMPSIDSFFEDNHKNHYVEFLARKATANTVTDQFGTTIKLWDATAFAAKTIPGAVNDLLLITGIPTSESFALRFRCNTVELAASKGISDYPASSTVSAHVDPISPEGIDPSEILSATAGPNAPSRTLAPVADTQVSSTNLTTNYGTTNNIFIQSATSGFGDERGWLLFDLSGLPSDAVIGDGYRKHRHRRGPGSYKHHRLPAGHRRLPGCRTGFAAPECQRGSSARRSRDRASGRRRVDGSARAHRHGPTVEGGSPRSRQGEQDIQDAFRRRECLTFPDRLSRHGHEPTGTSARVPALRRRVLGPMRDAQATPRAPRRPRHANRVPPRRGAPLFRPERRDPHVVRRGVESANRLRALDWGARGSPGHGACRRRGQGFNRGGWRGAASSKASWPGSCKVAESCQPWRSVIWSLPRGGALRGSKPPSIGSLAEPSASASSARRLSSAPGWTTRRSRNAARLAPRDTPAGNCRCVGRKRERGRERDVLPGLWGQRHGITRA